MLQPKYLGLRNSFNRWKLALGSLPSLVILSHSPAIFSYHNIYAKQKLTLKLRIAGHHILVRSHIYNFSVINPRHCRCYTMQVVPEKGPLNMWWRDSEWQWHQLGHMQVCNSFQTDTTLWRYTNLFIIIIINKCTTPLYRPDALPAAQPTASKHWR